MKISNFSRPKQRIFETAIELFAAHSFEIVTMDDIAGALGRKKPSIYNHFSSKQEILDTALDFFVEHFYDEKLPLEAFNPLIENGTLMEIIQAINFQFAPEYDLLMQQLYRILQQRKYHDSIAKKIFQEDMVNSCIEYAKDVWDYVVAKGRVEPFDTLSLSLMLHYVRQCTYLRWVVSPTARDYQHLLDEEAGIYHHYLLAIHDNRPPKA